MYNKTGQQFLLYTDANDIFIMSPGDVLEETKQISTKKCFFIQENVVHKLQDSVLNRVQRTCCGFVSDEIPREQTNNHTYIAWVFVVTQCLWL